MCANISPEQDSLAVRESDGIPWTWVDLVMMLGFAVFSVGTFLGRWKGVTPFIFLSSDAGIVSSFVAAYDHPEMFRGDVLLGDFNNFKYYLAVHPAYIHAMNKVIGDYGTAYLSMLLLTPFIQAAGFYLLGRLLFQSRYWAGLLAVMTLGPVALPIREMWGIYDDPLPRSLFHACLPYVLIAAFRFKSNPKLWPWVMVAVGAAFYTHPVSAPHWAFALWLGMWFWLPSDWSWYRKFGYMVVIGLVFVVTTVPWAKNYVLVHDRAADTTVQYKDVVGIIADRVGPELLSVRVALGMWWDAVSSWPLGFYCLWAVCWSVFVYRTRRNVRQDFFLVMVWIMGILFVAIGLTSIEETICKSYGLKRFQMDSVRGIKYLFPLMLLMCIWPLAEICRSLRQNGIGRAAVMLAGAAIVALWAYQHPCVSFVNAAQSWGKGMVIPPLSATERDAIDAVQAVRKNTDPDSRILPLALALEVRYAALRPVVYAYKDGGIFADTNLGEIPAWDKSRKAIEDLTLEQQKTAKLDKAVKLARELNAEYLLTDFPVDATQAASSGCEKAWSNNSFGLVSISAGKAEDRKSKAAQTIDHSL